VVLVHEGVLVALVQEAVLVALGPVEAFLPLLVGLVAW